MLRIKEIIKEKNLSSKEIAEKLSITGNAFSLIVNGKRQPRYEVLARIANALDVDIRELFHSTKEENRTNRLIVEHDGQYYPIGVIDRNLFTHFAFTHQLKDVEVSDLPETMEVHEYNTKEAEGEPEHPKQKMTGKERGELRKKYDKEYESTGFNSFWEVCHKATGFGKTSSHKRESFELWQKMTPAMREEAIKASPEYIKNLGFRQRNLHSYLMLFFEEGE
ncbi:MAG: helix-turn-helix transcriptional regulator [Bacteroidales bacterium]